MSTLETYKARWEDFRIDCRNLDHSRRALAHGYANEDVGADWDELCDRVDEFEDRIAHLSVFQRGELMSAEAHLYANI